MLLCLQTALAERTLHREVQPQLATLQGRVNAISSGNMTIRGLMLATVAGIQGNATLALRNTKNVSGPLAGLSLETLLFVVHTGEIIRYHKFQHTTQYFTSYFPISLASLLLDVKANGFSVTRNWILLAVDSELICSIRSLSTYGL